MSSRRRSRSRDRKAIPSKLRMDDNAPPTRITDPSLPAGRRREIDNVMKKARAQNSPTSSAIWEKKLLEVEAKDSNRWRHSGYKSLYLDGGGGSSRSSRSRSRSRSFSSSRRGAGASSPSPRRVARSPRGARSPRSPPPRARSPRSTPQRGRSPRSPPARARSPPGGYRGGRPRTPPSPGRKTGCASRRSASASSMSSCSDDSCSVCSPKHSRHRSRSRSFSPPPRPPRTSSSSGARKPPPPKPASSRPRPPSPAPLHPPRRMPRPMTPPIAKRMPRPNASDMPTDPRTRPPPPRMPPNKAGLKVGGNGMPIVATRIKKEGATRKKRPGSPGAESSGSDESPVVAVPIVATTAMTLSERFGKIAQWSADRERRDMENMRITKTGTNMEVLVDPDPQEFIYGSPPRRYSISPVPQGHYPDELLSAGQSRLAAWDDVRVRYQYYKDLGYLRDLSLDDYVKWEEWWYKYQDWLANERHYEHWLSTHGNSGGRRRKKRVPASQRLGA